MSPKIAGGFADGNIAVVSSRAQRVTVSTETNGDNSEIVVEVRPSATIVIFQ